MGAQKSNMALCSSHPVNPSVGSVAQFQKRYPAPVVTPLCEQACLQGSHPQLISITILPSVYPPSDSGHNQAHLGGHVLTGNVWLPAYGPCVGYFPPKDLHTGAYMHRAAIPYVAAKIQMDST